MQTFEFVPLLGLLNMGPMELLIIGGVAVLLFGQNLPSVARTLGASYQQFRKALLDLQGEFHSATYDSPRRSYSPSSSSATSSRSYRDVDDYDEATAPKFEPPPSEPQAESTTKT